MPVIHQFLAGFSNADAISNEALVLRRIFRSWGYSSDIFSESRRILPELRKEAQDFSEYASSPQRDDLVLLHLSIGSPLNACFAELPCRKAILYHNVTPSRYFELINKKTACDLAAGREQVRQLAGTAEVVLADSRFNAQELERLGYRDVGVLPLVLDLDRLKLRPDRRVMRKFGDGTVNVLFVGRCAPNKSIEDALSAFAHFHHFVQPNSRFIHVGSYAGTERYYYLLLTRVRELGLDGCVYFARSVPQDELNAYYECADVFLCMSEHEGFGIPLIESMVHDVPVLAYAAAAVPETLDGAGVLFNEKECAWIAELMGRLSSDTALRRGVIESQRERLSRYRRRDLESELKEHLKPLMAAGK